MAEFWFVRHGQTLFNSLGRFQGWCDSPLTEKGIRDAERAAKALKDVPFTKAYCSRSMRAQDTAEIILAGRDIPLKREKGLMEHYVGTIEGALVDRPEIREIIERCNASGDWGEVGGENIPDMKKRIRECLEMIAEESGEDDRILIVSHGSYCRYLLEELMGIDLKALQKGERKITVPNGGITRFTYENGIWKLISLPCDPDEYVS